MRKIFVLIILFSMSIALKSFGLLSDIHNSVLLAIGLVLLGAYTLSEIGSNLKLPRVTGYILAGLLLGPFALKILSSEVVQEIKMFNTLAIGLIAVTAGLELHFASLKKVILPILSTSLFKLVTLILLICGSLFIANQYLYDFGMGAGLGLFSLGLIFAALSLGTSPAISIAVISEMKAKSRLSQLVLGSAIVKDVLMVISLAMALSLAKSIESGGGDIAASFLHLLEELGYSLIAGAVLGAIFIFYIRFIRQEMFLFIAAMILVTAEISDAIHLELLLVFITAGVAVRNFSKEHHILHDALEKVSLPVFVVFFTNVGAGLDLAATWQFLPVAGLFFAARGVAFFISSYASGRWHQESPSIQKRAWLGYLPQAGVTLGLISIAARDFEPAAQVITNIGIGLVTLNLLIGPIFLRIVLKGEEPLDQEDLEPSPSQKIDPVEITGQEQGSPVEVDEQDFQMALHSLTE
ncbi:MAG: cation:proton antiporter, partial [Pseudomonadota bacterium]